MENKVFYLEKKMPIEVTERAILEARKVMDEQKMEEGKYGLSVGVMSGGCSGFQYKLGFEEIDKVNEEETIVSEFHGVKVFLNKESEPYLDGTVIDFHEGLDKRGFVFNNPQSTKCCGCGNSFSCGG